MKLEYKRYSKVAVLSITLLSQFFLFRSLTAEFFYFCLTEGRELVRILLAAGADSRAQDPHFRTVLHTAAMINDAELVKVIFSVEIW